MTRTVSPSAVRARREQVVHRRRNLGNELHDDHRWQPDGSGFVHTTELALKHVSADGRDSRTAHQVIGQRVPKDPTC